MKNPLRILSFCFVLGLANIASAQYVPYAEHFAIEDSYDSGKQTIIYAILNLKNQEGKDAQLVFRKYEMSTMIVLEVSIYIENPDVYLCHTDNSKGGITFESRIVTLESKSHKTICMDSEKTLRREYLIDLKKIPEPREIRLERNPPSYEFSASERRMMPLYINFVNEKGKGYPSNFTPKNNSYRAFDKLETILIEAKEILSKDMRPKPLKKLR